VLTPAVRRVLIFLLMMSVGLVLVFSLENKSSQPANKSVYETPQTSSGNAVTIQDLGSDTETQVKLGEIVFNVTSTVERPDGRLESRKAYRIHILRGAPDETGAFLVESPHVTFLDLETGADRGSVQADRGRFENRQAGPALGIFDPSSFDTKNFALTGNVHGEMVLGDGKKATFDGSELRAEGENLFSPGEVVLASETLVMFGTDMDWKGSTRKLTFATVSKIELLEEFGAVMESPTGLEWFVAEAGERGGYGTLFGPVKGKAADGSRLEGDQLRLSDNASSATLVGNARYDIIREDALWTLSADTITARVSPSGKWELTRAAGGVRLASENAEPPGWFETDQLDGLDQSLMARGPVRGQYGEISFTGTGLLWDEPGGQMDLLADVEIDYLSAKPGAGLSGAHIAAPGGLFLTTGDSGMRARFAGPVEGSAPGMGSFRCAELTYDEHAFEVVLSGSAFAQFELPERTRKLSGERITIILDELGTPSSVSSSGGVVLTEHGEPGLILRLAGPRLNVTATRVSAPDAFDLFWNGLDASGVGLALDNAQGVFKIDDSAHIARTLEDERVEWIEAARGVTWWAPKDSSEDPSEGHGEFRGPVRGRTADDVQFSADFLEVDGALQSADLLGKAVISHPTDGRVESDQFHLISGSAGLVIQSPVFVTWTSSQISGHGTGLDYSEEAGRLSLNRDVLIALSGPDETTFEIACDGLFTWSAPPGALDPFAQGVGEFHDKVVGHNPEGSRFFADRLLINLPKNQAELFGECLVQQLRDEKIYALKTGPSGYVRVETDSQREPVELDATGRVELVAGDMALEGDKLAWNVPEDHMVMSGDCRLQVFGGWMSMPFVEAWPEAMRWYIPRNISKIDVEP